MNTSAARSYIVRLCVASAVASAAWYFGVRPMRDNLEAQQASLAAAQSEIEAGQIQIMQGEQTPAETIADLRSSATAIEQLWAVSSDASQIYEAIDEIANRYGVVIERLEPRRGSAVVPSQDEQEDAPVFIELGYSIELVGSYEGVARFIRAIQNELGMARVDSFRISPALTQDLGAQIRASVRTTHYQVEGGLAAFDVFKEDAP